MARRTQPSAPDRGRGHRLRFLLLPVVAVLAFVSLAPAVAGAQEAPAGEAPTLAAVLAGDVEGVTAVGVVGESDGLDLAVTNEGDSPVSIAIPFGTLVATDVEGDQTLAVGPPDTPEVTEVAARGGTPTIEAEPGDSDHELPVYCAELDDGYPYESTVVHPVDDAHPVLAAALRQGSVEGASHSTIQSAVWWLSDEPLLPVGSDIAPLLAEVDTEGFAAAPHRVVPDTGYTPLWMREDVGAAGDGAMAPAFDDEEAAGIIDESYDGGSATPVRSVGGGGAAGIALWAVLIGLAVVAAVVVATRAGRTGPDPARLTAAAMPAGWYADPWGVSGHRYWDGRSWSGRTMG